MHFTVKDKAEILVQLDKLQHVKDELTTEVTNLHVQLEQERSKVHALSASEGKGKGVSIVHENKFILVTCWLFQILLWFWYYLIIIFPAEQKKDSQRDSQLVRFQDKRLWMYGPCNKTLVHMSTASSSFS